MDLDVRCKATLIGAAFLIDYMFFEKKANQENDGIGMAQVAQELDSRGKKNCFKTKLTSQTTTTCQIKILKSLRTIASLLQTCLQMLKSHINWM